MYPKGRSCFAAVPTSQRIWRVWTEKAAAAAASRSAVHASVTLSKVSFGLSGIYSILYNMNKHVYHKTRYVHLNNNLRTANHRQPSEWNSHNNQKTHCRHCGQILLCNRAAMICFKTKLLIRSAKATKDSTRTFRPMAKSWRNSNANTSNLKLKTQVYILYFDDFLRNRK